MRHKIQKISVKSKVIYAFIAACVVFLGFIYFNLENFIKYDRILSEQLQNELKTLKITEQAKYRHITCHVIYSKEEADLDAETCFSANAYSFFGLTNFFALFHVDFKIIRLRKEGYYEVVIRQNLIQSLEKSLSNHLIAIFIIDGEEYLTPIESHLFLLRKK